MHREKSALPRTETKEEGSKDEDKKKDNGNQGDEDHSLTDMLKRFWDLESIGITPINSRTAEMSPNEKLAWKKVSESVKLNDGYYEVAVPWKKQRPSLPNNAELALADIDREKVSQRS